MNTANFARSSLLLLLAAILLHIPWVRADGLPPQVPIGGFQCSVWKVDEGLPNNSIINILPSKEGYLWLATYEGVVRFDGTEFSVIPPPSHVSLAHQFYEMREDSEGRLWLVCKSGALLMVQHGEMREILPQDEGGYQLDSVASGPGSSLGVSRGRLVKLGGDGLSPVPQPEKVRPRELSFFDGTFWILGTEGEILRQEGESWVRIPLQGNEAAITWETTDSALIVAAPSNVWAWEGHGFGPLSKGPRNIEKVSRLISGHNDLLWIKMGTAWRLWSRGTWISGPVEMDAKNYSDGLAEVDQSGNLWIMQAFTGLLVISKDGEIQKLDLAQHGLGRRYRNLTADSERNIWVGNLGSGLLRFRPRSFDTFTPAQGAASLPNCAVLRKSDGTIWIGALDRLAVSRWKDGAMTAFIAPKMSETRIGSLVEDEDGNLLAATDARGLWKISADGIFEKITLPAEIGEDIRSVCRDREGSLWLGCSNGVWCIRKNLAPLHFTVDDGLPHKDVTLVKEAPNGSIWVGTIGGASYYREGKWTTIPAAGTSAGNQVRAMYIDPGGTVWIGTRGGGIRCWDNEKMISLTTTEGLSSNYICGIGSDADRNIWITSYNGLMRIPPGERAVRFRNNRPILPIQLFGKSDGLPTAQFSELCDPPIASEPDGMIWLTTSQGIVRFDPRRAAPPPKKVPVVIREVTVNGSGVAPAPQLDIGPGVSRLTISFGAVYLGTPEKLSYRYRLVGHDADWSEPTRNRQAAFSQISPGTYTFEVVANSGSGSWNELDFKKITLRVVPHFTRTWWFLFLIVFFSILIIYVLHRLDINRSRALEQIRLRIARDLHDEVGGSLGAIALLGGHLQEHTNSPDAGEIRSLALSTVATLNEIVWLTNPSSERLEQIINRMKSIARMMLPQSNFTFNVSNVSEKDDVPMSWRRNLLPFFKEALHNIARHADASEVLIFIQTDRNGYFNLSIIDNGCGFEPDLVSPGNGLLNFSRRAAEMNCQFTLHSKPGEGTKLFLQGKIK